MTLDRTLAREIKAVNGDGSRQTKFQFLAKLDAAKKDLSTTSIRENFDSILKKHGRATVAICVAATLWLRRERMEHCQLHWALAVLDLWTNRSASNLDRAYIDDGLHPTRICEYAGPFIRLTTEES